LLKERIAPDGLGPSPLLSDDKGSSDKEGRTLSSAPTKTDLKAWSEDPRLRAFLGPKEKSKVRGKPYFHQSKATTDDEKSANPSGFSLARSKRAKVRWENTSLSRTGNQADGESSSFPCDNWPYSPPM